MSELADKLYARSPGTPAAPTLEAGQASIADRLYGERPPAAEEWRLASNLGANSEQIAELTALAGKNNASPPNDATTAEWQRQTSAALITRFGEKAAGVLDMTREYVRRTPALHKLLGANGFGNHPKVVEHFVNLALKQREGGTW